MDKDSLIRDAQYRKSLSIAFFNATNSAIEMAKIMGLVGVSAEEFIIKWRNWFLEEHKQHYAAHIASIGKPYNVEEALKYLGEAKDLEDLRGRWLLLSEDERRDETILAFMKGLKSKLQPKSPKNEKAQ